MSNMLYLVLFKSFQIEYILKLLFLEKQLARKQQKKHPHLLAYMLRAYLHQMLNLNFTY